jgi:transcriptional regulator NrdR family protein
MNCPYCNSAQPRKSTQGVQRAYSCSNCSRKFLTREVYIETYHATAMRVLKEMERAVVLKKTTLARAVLREKGYLQ